METTSILITGDFVPYGRVLKLVEENNNESVFNDFAQHLKNSDFNITNLECPLINTGKRNNKIGPHLKAPIQTAKFLRDSNFNVVTLSNNHILDYGPEGLKSTLEVCQKNNILTVGAGLNEQEILKPIILKGNGNSIGLINVSEIEFSYDDRMKVGANAFDYSNLIKTINQLKKSVEFIIVIAHGGHEFYQFPSPELVKKYRLLIEVGADLVIGHHPHCYSGFETYMDKNIFYSLGNFSFDWAEIKEPSWTEGYALKLRIKNNELLNHELIPYTTGKVFPGIFLLSSDEEIKFNRKIEEINKVIESDDLLKAKWDSYVEEMTEKYMTLIQPTNKYIKALQLRKLLPRLFFRSNKNRLTLLNLLRCESHREMLVSILGKKKS